MYEKILKAHNMQEIKKYISKLESGLKVQESSVCFMTFIV